MLLNWGVGEDSWESIGLQGDQPVHPQGNHFWIFIGRTDAKTLILWPPNAKSWLIGKDPDAGKDWGQEEKGTTEDEMVGWHHRLHGHGFGWTPVAGDGQGGLACYGSWGCKESNMTEWVNWTELNWQEEDTDKVSTMHEINHSETNVSNLQTLIMNVIKERIATRCDNTVFHYIDQII